MAGIMTPEEAAKARDARIAAGKGRVSTGDYNDALEGYLRKTREARGYTDRDPSEYYNSGVPRWAQDARDWVAFRDKVMTYGLQVLNKYQQTGEPPCTLEDFVEGLRKIDIHWTIQSEQ